MSVSGTLPRTSCDVINFGEPERVGAVILVHFRSQDPLPPPHARLKDPQKISAAAAVAGSRSGAKYQEA